MAERLPLEMFDLAVGSTQLSIAQVASADGAIPPRWARVRPAALALAKVIGAIPDLSGKRFIDLACGPGALGLVAASRGARAILSDPAGEGVELAKANAERNGLAVEAVLELDWNAPPEGLGRFDGIVAADVLDEGGLRGVLRFVRAHLAQDGMAWIADSTRPMPGGFEGAARLCGLEANSSALMASHALSGVTLYEVWLRPAGPSARRGDAT